jgi:hypothetical protein
MLRGYRLIPGIADQDLDQIQQLGVVIDNQDGVQRRCHACFPFARETCR